MQDADLAGFVQAGLRHVWGDRPEEHMPGLSSTVRDGDVGFMAFYSDEYVKWSSIVVVDAPLSVELMKAVQGINSGLPIGTLTVQPADDGDCLILWSYKILPSWLDADSQTSAKLIVDVRTNVPNMVRMSRERLSSVGGRAYVPDSLGTLMFFS